MAFDYNSVENKNSSINDVSIGKIGNLTIMLRLDDGNVFVIPLTDTQAVVLFKLLGVNFDKKTGLPTCLSNTQLNDIYHIV